MGGDTNDPGLDHWMPVSVIDIVGLRYWWYLVEGVMVSVTLVGTHYFHNVGVAVEGGKEGVLPFRGNLSARAS